MSSICYDLLFNKLSQININKMNSQKTINTLHLANIGISKQISHIALIDNSDSQEKIYQQTVEYINLLYKVICLLEYWLHS